MLFPGRKIRRSAWWDDHGEMHPFDCNGPDFNLRLDVPASPYRISMYMLDYDWRNTVHPRQHSILVFNSKGEFEDALWTGKIGHGNYLKKRGVASDNHWYRLLASKVVTVTRTTVDFHSEKLEDHSIHTIEW